MSKQIYRIAKLSKETFTKTVGLVKYEFIIDIWILCKVVFIISNNKIIWLAWKNFTSEN